MKARILGVGSQTLKFYNPNLLPKFLTLNFQTLNPTLTVALSLPAIKIKGQEATG